MPEGLSASSARLAARTHGFISQSYPGGRATCLGHVDETGTPRDYRKIILSDESVQARLLLTKDATPDKLGNNKGMNENKYDHDPLSAVDFIPPAPTHALIHILQTFWTAYAKLSEFNLTIRLDASIRTILKTLEHERVILCPNHSAHDDPLVAFAIASQVHQQFYYLTAREIFKWHPSLRSLWLQHLGCYSVLRASPDIEAYKETCSLLLKGPNKVVIFPEGEVTHQNKFVMSLENGAERMALTTAQALASAGSNEPVYILPVGIIYRHAEDLADKLLAILGKQETKLGLVTDDAGNVEQRICRAYEKMLSILETEHRCRLPGPSTIGERISNFIERTVQELAAECAVPVPEAHTQRERLHILKKVFINHRFANRKQVISDHQRLLYCNLKRAVNLIGITDKSFRALHTQERVAELISILEYEVSGRVSLHCPKTAIVASAKPIDVRSFTDSLTHDRATTLQTLNSQVYAGINDALIYLNATHPERPLRELYQSSHCI